MNYTVNLPYSQRELLVRILTAISVLKLDDLHADFDVTTLIAIFKDPQVDVRIELEDSTYNEFASRNGVDFPEYTTKYYELK